MREHAHLPAMVGFMRKHVTEHFHTDRPGASPAVPAKLLDSAATLAERFSEHLRAASGALLQRGAGLPRRAASALELSWKLEVRGGKPDPLGADVVHVREDGRNSADLAGRFGFPGGRVKILDENLVHAIVGGKNPDGSSREFGVNFWHVNPVLTRGHGSPLPVNSQYSCLVPGREDAGSLGLSREIEQIADENRS